MPFTTYGHVMIDNLFHQRAKLERIPPGSLAGEDLKRRHPAMSSAQNPFGDGHAAERIVNILAETLSAGRAVAKGT